MNGNHNDAKNNKWQRRIALATTAIAAVGAIATWVYNTQQTRFREIEVVEKFFEHLVSPDQRLSNMAKLTVEKLLSNKELANQLIQAAVEVTTEEEATQLNLSSSQLDKRRTARVDRIEGWAYLGNKSNGTWQTRYFDFKANDNPLKFTEGDGKLRVREATGSLNLRQNMPNPDGTFPPVIDVLDPGTEVSVQEVRAWQSTGYMWAKVVVVPTD